eukprot:263114-Chlamydomonas_euryale.AAC.1
MSVCSCEALCTPAMSAATRFDTFSLSVPPLLPLLPPGCPYDVLTSSALFNMQPLNACSVWDPRSCCPRARSETPLHVFCMPPLRPSHLSWSSQSSSSSWTVSPSSEPLRTRRGTSACPSTSPSRPPAAMSPTSESGRRNSMLAVPARRM